MYRNIEINFADYPDEIAQKINKILNFS